MIGCAAPGHLGHGRADDLCQRPLSDRIRQHGCRRIGPHPACVRAGIAVADTLVVLRCADGQHILPVTQHKERGFLALHELLDHHFGACRAELAAEHVVNRGLGLRQRLGDDNALARGQAICFHHNGRTLRAYIVLGGCRIGEMPIGCCRCATGIANLFGKGLGRFQRCGGFGGAKHQNTRLAQPVRHACGQRCLRPDDDKVDVVALGKLDDRAAIIDVDTGAIGDLGDARITRRHDQLVAFRVL